MALMKTLLFRLSVFSILLQDVNAFIPLSKVDTLSKSWASLNEVVVNKNLHSPLIKWNNGYQVGAHSGSIRMSLDSNNYDDSDLEKYDGNIWSPKLRRIMGTLSGIGLLETAYLTFLKVTSSEPAFCSLQGSCGDVLNGPYSSLGDIPLSAFGFLAYTSVAALALYPILVPNKDSITDDDSFNRLALVTITTSMATFSSFLLSLLLNILHESCIYCFLSVGLSMSLAMIVWFGGATDNIAPQSSSSSKTWPILQTGLSSAVVTTIASIVFYTSIDSIGTTPIASASSSSNIVPPGGYSPPAITTVSSSESLQLAQKLNNINAQMFGAYWCSHCYDQKQSFGKESMKYVNYVECDKDGKNSQTALCKEKKVPGYPTWIIDQELYPGEQSLEELNEIVDKVLGGKK